MGVTFGSSSAPSQITKNLDSVFAQSLAAYRKELADNIATSNAFTTMLMKGDLYDSQDGGTHIEVPLMYALAVADWYEGYDELSTQPTDGITNAVYQWRQMAVPIAYSMKEMKQNKQRILNLVTSRIKQSEMGIKETWATALWQGTVASAGSINTAQTSPVNGATGIDPLPLFIKFDPTTSTTIGNISQSTSTWWRNKTSTSTATTYDAFMLEFDHIFNATALGTGGKPDIIGVDQVTYELIVHALWQKYRQTSSDNAFPFENTLFKGARIVMDEKIPDCYTDAYSASLTYGSAYFINSQFFNVTYESETNFVMLEDENGKTFAKPINGDSRVGHIAWMGNLTCSNRRKQGVMGKIARTLTLT